MQGGKVNEFISKENKWFNNIIGLEDAGIEDALDTGEFSLQGLGFASTIEVETAARQGRVSTRSRANRGGNTQNNNY